MRKSRFTEAQVFEILKEVDQGTRIGEVCQKHGISEATFYLWRSRFRNMESAEIKQTRELNQENARLRQQLADLTMENHSLRDIISRQLTPPLQYMFVTRLQVEHGFSLRWACETVGVTRTAYWQYQASCSPADSDAREALAMAPRALRQSA